MAKIKARFKSIKKPDFAEACRATVSIFLAAVIVAAITAGFDLGVSKLVQMAIDLFV